MRDISLSFSPTSIYRYTCGPSDTRETFREIQDCSCSLDQSPNAPNLLEDNQAYTRAARTAYTLYVVYVQYTRPVTWANGGRPTVGGSGQFPTSFTAATSRGAPIPAGHDSAFPLISRREALLDDQSHQEHEAVEKEVVKSSVHSLESTCRVQEDFISFSESVPRTERIRSSDR